jgi:hypothetical protein
MRFIIPPADVRKESMSQVGFPETSSPPLLIFYGKFTTLYTFFDYRRCFEKE